MKTNVFLMLGIMCISNAAFCATSTTPNQRNLKAAMTRHLAKEGDLCVGKFNWPIDVNAHDVELGSRDAIQLPVMEKLGLVSSANAFATIKVDETETTVPVTRYSLTDTGKKYYVNRDMESLAPDGKKIVRQGDFCAARLSLNKIVKWDQPKTVAGTQETTVTYTYKIAAADWVNDPEMQKVFPMIDRVVKGEGSMQLKQRVRLTKAGWVAVSLWD